MLIKIRCPIGSKKAVFNRVIKGGPAFQKYYARVWPGRRVSRLLSECLVLARTWTFDSTDQILGRVLIRNIPIMLRLSWLTFKK